MLNLKKRRWAALTVNMTPLIDVVFLIIIFFIIMINFSEKHIQDLNLPSADEARTSQIAKQHRYSLVIKSPDLILLQRKMVSLESLGSTLRQFDGRPDEITVQIRADRDIPYEIVKRVMATLAEEHYGKIELATLQGPPNPLEKE